MAKGKPKLTSRRFKLITFMHKLKTNYRRAADYAQDSGKQSEQGHYADLRDLFGAAYALAQFLDGTPDALAEFVNLPFFTEKGNRPQTGDSGKLLAVAVRYVFGATSRQLRERCLRAAKALRPHFDAGVPASEIPALIKKHRGIEAMYEATKGNDDKKRPPERNNQKTKSDEDKANENAEQQADNDEDDRWDDDKEDRKKTPSRRTPSRMKTPIPRLTLPRQPGISEGRPKPALPPSS